MACGFCEAVVCNSVGTLPVDWVAKPVKRQLDYVRHFHENVEMLTTKKGEVEMARTRLQHEIEEAERQLQQIEYDVRDSQSKVANILTRVESMERRIAKNKRCFSCSNWWWRYRLSKKLETKTLSDIDELLEKMAKFGQPGRVGYRDASAIPTIEFLLSKDFVVSKSSKAASNQIMAALKDENVSMIGLWGMGGVGKTTLVCEVGNYAKKIDLFPKVAIATVSKDPNFEAIQDAIARDLQFDMEDQQGRRKSKQDFWSRLQKEERILIILDDVWRKINLKEDIGIPFGEDHKGCKILLTTRRLQVCQSMKCQKEIPLGCLDADEAWALFERKAGLESSDDAIKEVASEVIKKCQGLPISIVALGTALNGKNIDRWNDTCWRLQNRRLMEIEDIDVDENAYLCLEESFNYLKDMETKICFLLCSLFPEDYQISMEELVRYAWGLDLYKGIDSIEKVRSRVRAAMGILKDSCLLLDCGGRHVKMHDTVRDVALWTASNRKDLAFDIKSGVVERWPDNECFDSCTAISFITSRIAELPDGLVCPNLKILLLGGDIFNTDKCTPTSAFFEGMKMLQVCSLRSRKVSPDAFQFQTNIRTLHLHGCRLSNISLLGKLKELKVLSLAWSDIKELPDEIGDLNNIRLLDLLKCHKLQRIPPNLLRRLSRLEEVYLDGCRLLTWATGDTIQEGRYASLSELNSLSKLTVLSSLWVYSDEIPKDCVFQRLRSFDIHVKVKDSRRKERFWDMDSRRKQRYWEMDYEKYQKSRSLRINASKIDAFQQLIGDAESLYLADLDQEGAFELRSVQPGLGDDVKFRSLKVVKIESCNKLKYLFPMSIAKCLGQLETLEIKNCLRLEEIIQKTEASNVSLQRLREVIVEGCSELKSFFSLSHGQVLKNLTSLEIRNCCKMEYTFPFSNMAEALPQLKVVQLWTLPQLKATGGNVLMINLPSLDHLDVQGCPQLSSSNFTTLSKIKELCIGSITHSEELFDGGYDFSILNGLCLIELQELRVIWKGPIQVDVNFQNLTELVVMNCKRLNYVLPPTTANLPQLRVLKIIGCEELQQIIGKDETSSRNCHHLLPIRFPNLTHIFIKRCENLKSLFSISTAAHGLPKLENLTVYYSKIEQVFEGGDAANVSMADEDKVIKLPELVELSLVNLPNIVSFSPVGYHFIFPYLVALDVTDCPNITTRFSADSKQGWHAKTEILMDSSCSRRTVESTQLIGEPSCSSIHEQ